jgi:integrase
VSRIFTKLAREAGLPTIRLHDLRHGYASLALQAGVHLKIASERLGHSSVTVTLDTYSHAIPGLQRDAAERVAALIPGLGGPA